MDTFLGKMLDEEVIFLHATSSIAVKIPLDLTSLVECIDKSECSQDPQCIFLETMIGVSHTSQSTMYEIDQSLIGIEDQVLRV